MALNHNELTPDNYGYHKDLVDSYNSYMNNIKNNNLKIGYLSDCEAIHLYHGSLENRNYGKKQVLEKLNIFRNDEDVLEWEDKSANEILMSNFLSRKEDD